MYANKRVKTNSKQKARIVEFLILSFFAVVLIGSGIPLVRHYAKARHLQKGAEEELRDLETNRDSLQATTQELESQEGKDRYIRDTYHVAEPGEVMMIIVPGE